MSDYENFNPINEEEEIWVEKYNMLSQKISSMLRGLPKEEGLKTLQDLNMSDLALMNLYLQAMKNEDYETCNVAKILLLERGFKIPI